MEQRFELMGEWCVRLLKRKGPDPKGIWPVSRRGVLARYFGCSFVSLVERSVRAGGVP